MIMTWSKFGVATSILQLKSMWFVWHSVFSSGPVSLQWSQAFKLDPLNQPLRGSGTDWMVPVEHSGLAWPHLTTNLAVPMTSAKRKKKAKKKDRLAGANRPLSDSIVLPCGQSQGSGLHEIPFCLPSPTIIREAAWPLVASSNWMLLENVMTAIT